MADRLDAAHRRHHYIIGLGSNLGYRRRYLVNAISELATFTDIIALSRIYETDPIGIADRKFLNAAVFCRTALAPVALLDNLLAVEYGLGRIRRRTHDNREIDLDILLWADLKGRDQWHDRRLTIPHPRLWERAFANIPAEEVAPLPWRRKYRSRFVRRKVHLEGEPWPSFRLPAIFG